MACLLPIWLAVSSTRGPCSHRQTAANDFPKAGQVWLDPEAALCPAQTGSKSGNDLVEDEKHAVTIAQIADTLQKAICGCDDPHISRDGFDNEGGNLPAMCFAQTFA